MDIFHHNPPYISSLLITTNGACYYGQRRHLWIGWISFTILNTYTLLLDVHPTPAIIPAPFGKAYHQRNTKDGKRQDCDLLDMSGDKGIRI